MSIDSNKADNMILYIYTGHWWNVHCTLYSLYNAGKNYKKI